MKLFVIAASCIVLTLLASCESKYGQKQGRGDDGYTEIMLDVNTARISFVGAPFETVNRYALYRSAELTTEKGFDHFIIINDSHSGDSRTNDVAILTIRMFKGMPLQNEFAAYDAKAMISAMTPYITRDTTK
jgi:hypothetical protein